MIAVATFQFIAGAGSRDLRFVAKIASPTRLQHLRRQLCRARGLLCRHGSMRVGPSNKWLAPEGDDRCS
jgi:hypothetical protein